MRSVFTQLSKYHCTAPKDLGRKTYGIDYDTNTYAITPIVMRPQSIRPTFNKTTWSNLKVNDTFDHFPIQTGGE
jgi:hypothetical protein